MRVNRLRPFLGWVMTACLVMAGLTACTGTGATPSAPTPSRWAWPTPANLGTIQQLIEQRAGDQLRSVGQGRNVVEVALGPAGASLAGELVDAYGAAVHVQVGFLEFPSGKLVGQPCDPRWSIVSRTDVRATVEMASTTLASGADFRATIRVQALEGRTIGLDTGQPLLVYLFRPGTMTPIAAFDGTIGGTGLAVSVEPSTSRTIAALGSTASCDPTLGYALPAGTYEARALVEDGTMATSQTFWSDPLRIEVVAP